MNGWHPAVQPHITLRDIINTLLDASLNEWVALIYQSLGVIFAALWGIWAWFWGWPAVIVFAAFFLLSGIFKIFELLDERQLKKKRKARDGV